MYIFDILGTVNCSDPVQSNTTFCDIIEVSYTRVSTQHVIFDMYSGLSYSKFLTIGHTYKSVRKHNCSKLMCQVYNTINNIISYCAYIQVILLEEVDEYLRDLVLSINITQIQCVTLVTILSFIDHIKESKFFVLMRLDRD